MTGTTIEFRANGHTAHGHLALPPGGTGPGVVVLQEWWGLVGHITDVADRLAAEGFVALAPDLYHGERAGSPDEAGKLLMALDIDRATADLRGALEHLRGLDAVQPARTAVLGFCMGGQLALYAGGALPGLVDAVVDFYGIHPRVEPDLAALRAPVLFHFGEHDASVPRERARALAAAIAERGGVVEAHHYDAGHAFFNDDRPAVFDPDAAALAWDRTLAFLRRHLA